MLLLSYNHTWLPRGPGGPVGEVITKAIASEKINIYIFCMWGGKLKTMALVLIIEMVQREVPGDNFSFVMTQNLSQTSDDHLWK